MEEVEVPAAPVVEAAPAPKPVNIPVVLVILPGVNVYTAPVTGTMVITPSKAPGQLVLVVDEPVEVAAPAPTLILLEPEHPFASVNVAV